MTTRIVVVEDDALLAEQYLRSLRRAGYETYHAPHVIEAIDVIDTVKPHAILLDMLLAGTTALALLHELQSHPDLSDIPIVMATNLADQIDLENVRSYGVKRVLDKATMYPDDIITAIRSVIR